MELWQKFHEEQRKFLSNISWEDVVKNNELLSQLTSLYGGGGGSGGGAIGNQINYNHNSSSSFYFKIDTVGHFNQNEIIESLKVAVENRLKLNQLEITKTESQKSTFTFEYKGRYLTGKVKFLGRITENYYQISLTKD